MRANIIRLRKDQRMGYTELSERLKDLDRRIPPLGLRRIENGARRVDADDLFALAAALGVSPVTLLMPNASEGDQEVQATGVIEKGDAESLWGWLLAHEPLDPDVETVDFRLAALPLWKRRQLIKTVTVNFSGAATCLLERPSDGNHQQVPNIRRCNTLPRPLPEARGSADR